MFSVECDSQGRLQSREDNGGYKRLWRGKASVSKSLASEKKVPVCLCHGRLMMQLRITSLLCLPKESKERFF